MAKQHLYYEKVLNRKNLVLDFIYSLFLAVASYPRMIGEVFIRKNFGERYFSMVTGVTIAAGLYWVPSLVDKFIYGSFFSGPFDRYSWYAFIAAFLTFSIVHWYRMDHTPGVFDFAKFSKYSGDIHPLFKKINILGWTPDIRTIETLLEPALFFIIGFVFNEIGFKLGGLLMFVGVFYSFGYLAAYKSGDDFVMDTIDKIILGEEKQNAFVHGMDAEECRGVRFYAERPTLRKDREQVADAMEFDPSKVEFTFAE
jgi:hypothetical protein